ncbi:SRPBCC family protein [Arthrobacter sp. U41]|uniref:SRPBCC family protein n=1 Tax=Arthrobacter sp. U41 TaxID=1849032 RepID=UPI0012FC92C0|nr:SRPBCC domain-containing protein [Arthrobacter sp. U41]
MEKLRYSVTIDAPVRDVWTTMLNDATYREWTSVFNSDSYYEGNWSQGSEIRFLGPDGDGSVAGMIATVEENRPHELISLRYIGQVVNGEDDTTSEAAKAFMGAHEKYAFSAAGGVTTVDVELDSEEEFVAMFDEAWRWRWRSSRRSWRPGAEPAGRSFPVSHRERGSRTNCCIMVHQFVVVQ